MFLNPALSAALDRITERAADVRRAFTPGGMPQHDDVAVSGQSEVTIDPLSVAAGDGLYFIARDERGGPAFSGDGSFTLRGGRLVDREGYRVCGISRSGQLTDLQTDAVDAALGRVTNPRIERDGSFVYDRTTLDPRSGTREAQRVVVGRIALARFPAGTRLSEEEGGLRVPPPGVTPQLGAPGNGDFALVAPMHRSANHIDLDESLTRLREAYLTFDALQAAEIAKGHLGKTAMDLLK